jgi:hypothetical protein
MPLTDARIRNAKPTAKTFKLGDGGGMYLLVTPPSALRTQSRERPSSAARVTRLEDRL